MGCPPLGGGPRGRQGLPVAARGPPSTLQPPPPAPSITPPAPSSLPLGVQGWGGGVVPPSPGHHPHRRQRCRFSGGGCGLFDSPPHAIGQGEGGMAPSLNIFPISPHQAESGWGYGSLKDRELGGDALPGDGTPGVSVMLGGGKARTPGKPTGPLAGTSGKPTGKRARRGLDPLRGWGRAGGLSVSITGLIATSRPIKNASVPLRKELQEKRKIHHFEFPY